MSYDDLINKLKKSNYGPSGASQYSVADNARRKENNTGSNIDAGKNSNVKEYTTSGSSTQAAHEKKQLRLERRKSVRSAKVFTPEEREAYIKKLAEKEKGGEGSRGGHVIGHTPKGNPIYESSKKSMSDEAKVISLMDKLKKGGEGSGVKGHMTAKKPSDAHPGVHDAPATPMNKLQAHLMMLKEGGIIPGVKTQSGKPIVTSMDSARAHGYDTQDHIDAVNAHYELAHKTQAMIEKLKTAGHKPPPEGAKIAQFHENKMREHMSAYHYLKERKKHTEAAIKEKKADAVKKAVTQMGGGLGDRDLDVGSFAQANSKADAEWLERLYQGMSDFGFGDEPRSFECPKGRINLAKVDDGLYSGFFTQVDTDGLEDNARVRIERMTIPELVNFMVAKEWISNPVLSPEVPTAESKDSVDELAQRQMGALGKDLPGMVSAPQAQPSVADRLRMLELISKLLG